VALETSNPSTSNICASTDVSMSPWSCHCQLVTAGGAQQPTHATGAGSERATVRGSRVGAAEAVGAPASTASETESTNAIGRRTIEVSVVARRTLDRDAHQTSSGASNPSAT
jgi:hypothetical protein